MSRKGVVRGNSRNVVVFANAQAVKPIRLPDEAVHALDMNAHFAVASLTVAWHYVLRPGSASTSCLRERTLGLYSKSVDVRHR
jgi:hypothetical protein